MRYKFSLKSLALPFGVLLLINMLALDIFIAFNTHPTTAAKTTHPRQTDEAIPTPLPTITVSQKNIISPTTQPVNQSTPYASAGNEFFIPLGTGTSTASTWTNVPGVQAYIDSSQYPNIQTVTFEASVVLPASLQIVSVQLYNMTANHPVWFSQVTLQSSNGTGLLISNPITLDPGNNLYQVQMQTQLQAPANLVQSRVHIITN